MLEILLRPTNSLQYYPNSGPGTKYLRQGDTDLGVFGEVLETDIGIFPALMDAVGVPSADRLFNPLSVNTWIKMFYKGKVIYLPMFPTARVSYQLLENAKVTYDFFKAGTPDAPTTLPSGKPMWRLGPIFETASGAVFYPRLLDAKPNAASATEGEAITETAEFYQTVLSVFFTQYNNSKNVKLSGDYILKFVGNQSPLVHVSESSSATSSARTPINSGHASFGKVTVWTASGSTELWMPALQLLDKDDLAKVPVAPSFIESWTDEVNSKPVGWADSDALIPPYNFRAPNSQSIIGIEVVADEVFGVVVSPPFSNGLEGRTSNTMSEIEPTLLTPGIISARDSSYRVSVVNDGSPAFTVFPRRSFGTGMAIAGGEPTINGRVMYSVGGLAGTNRTGGFLPNAQYPNVLTQCNLDTKIASQSGSGLGYTWNRGADSNTHFYRFGGDIGYPAPHFVRVSKSTLAAANISYPAAPVKAMQVCFGKLQDGMFFQTCGIDWRPGAAVKAPRTTFIINPANDTVTTCADSPVRMRFGAVINKGNRVFVFGGTGYTDAGTETKLTQITIYDRVANTWSVLDGYRSIFSGQNGVLYNNKFIVVGVDSTLGTSVAAGFVFDLDTETLKYFTLGIRSSVVGGFQLADDGLIYLMCGMRPLFAGENSDNALHSNLVHVFDPEDFMQ